MNTIISFNHHRVTVIGTSTDPWFSASDVCSIIGYHQSVVLSALSLNVDDCDWKYGHEITTFYRSLPLDKYLANSIFINESGLMDLVCSSRLPIAKSFKRYYFSVLRNNISRPTSLTIALEENARLQNLLDIEIRNLLPEINKLDESEFEQSEPISSWCKIFM